MDSKCSLHDFNSYLQFMGLLSLIIILFIAVLYYLRVYHNNILEKYDEGSIDIKTIESKTGSLNNRSTYPKDKYPGRNMNEISSSTDANDKYTFRDCKVYFTESKDKIDECDRQSDNMKKCSYTFDGWKEFATYTDNYGNIIDYPKKIYTNTKTNSSDFINSDFTSKCFKMFDYGGKGSAKPFEYAENNVIKYDSKGTLNNTEKDTNIFNGLRYTSIQFLNKDNVGDNLTNVLDSICSLKYNTIDSIKDKKFYKLLFDSNKNITDILKVQLNSSQTVFDEINKNAVLDFAILATHGIKYDATNNLFKIFIKEVIDMKAKIFVFNYVSYVCPLSQIKNYTTTTSELNVTSFAIFRNKLSNNSVNFRLNGVNMNILDWSKYTEGNIDYKFAIIDDLNVKIDDRKKTITDNEKQIINGLNSNIASKDSLISEAYSAKNKFSTNNNKFVDILNLTRNDGITKIFNYNKGYYKNTIKELNIPNGVKCKYINSNEIYLEFNNDGNSKTPYSFIVPENGYICDILVVGGGGAGGGAGGAGGGGDVKEFKDITLSAGVYNINVGKGGVTVDNNQAGTVGNESTFSGNNLDIKIAGGGGGGGYGWNVGICEWRWYGWVWKYRCWKYDEPGIASTIAPTANYVDPKTGAVQKSSGAGGGVRQGSGRATTDGSSGSGGTNVDNNWETGGAGGGAAPSSEGGNAGSSRRWNGLSTGDGGKGVKSSITGESVEYGGGGSGARWNGGVDTYGVSSGGAGNFKNGYFLDVNNNKGGGGIMYRNGGSGVVIIRIKNINTNYNISIETDNYYKLAPVSQINFPSYKLQNNIITSFIFLQKGYYRFRVDMGNNPSYTNPNILYSELMIYDELNLKDTTNYNCITAFKYSKYNNEMKPSYLKQFIKIATSKFYKVAYYYVSHNNTNNAQSSNFNIFFKYLDAPPVRLENTLPPNLIAWYKFDSNYKEDSNPSGTKYTLTKNGNISNTLNEEGRSFINTSGGSLETDTSINLARKSFSISVWRRMRNSGYGFFVVQGSQDAVNKYLHIGARGNNAYCLGFFYNDLECGAGTGTATSYPEDVNVWTHLVYTVEETIDKKYDRKIYRNGSLISQDQTTKAYIGGGSLKLGNNIDVDISNFLVFNRAISKEEVDILYYNDYNFTSTSSPQTTYIEINKTVNKNDESLFTRNNIPSINVPANDYLFCGNIMYADYKNTDNTIMDLFTDIKYDNNNYINYQKIANYIYADPIDYFRITKLRSEKASIERQIKEVEDNLPVKIRNDAEIADINKLLTAINNIKYNELLPIDDVSIKPNSGILNIFGDNYANLLTYDRVNNYNSLVSNPINTTTSSSIYIEAIN